MARQALDCIFFGTALFSLMAIFHDALRRALAETDVQQTELATRLSMSRTHLNRLANAKVKVGPRTVARVMSAFDEGVGSTLLAAFLHDEVGKVEQAAIDEDLPTKASSRHAKELVRIKTTAGRSPDNVSLGQMLAAHADEELAELIENALVEAKRHPDRAALLKSFLVALHSRKR